MALEPVRVRSQVHSQAWQGTGADTVPPCGDAVWRVSSRSSGSTSCVEATACDGLVSVRNSTNPTGPTLTVPASGWLVFLDEVLAGRIHSAGPHDATAGPFTIRLDDSGAIELAGQQPAGPVIVFTHLEWEIFIDGVVQDQEFTLEWLTTPAAVSPAQGSRRVPTLDRHQFSPRS